MATNWQEALSRTLLDEDQRLKLPMELASAYSDILRARGLEAKAGQAAATRSVYGGCTDEQAEAHFALRFPNSAIRSTAAYADPSRNFARAGSLVRRLLSNGRLVILDLPSGAGAASLGLILTAACLREVGCVPAVPLSIHLVAADCAEYALARMRELLERVDPHLRRNGIYCELHLRVWNAEYSYETSSLFDQAYAISADHYLIVTADFSGAAGGEGFLQFRDSFVTIRDRVHNNPNAYWIHIEPAQFTKARKLLKLLQELPAALLGGTGVEDPLVEACELQWRALFTDQIVPVRVQIKLWRGEHAA